jgi:hypothetical protein
MSDKQSKNKNRTSGWVALLGQLRSPLTFFGLSLLVVESAFSGVLWRHSYSEKTAVIIVCLMAGLFALSVLSVLFLTYRVPQNIVLQESRVVAQEAREQRRKLELEEARQHLHRARQAVALVLDYAENGDKDVASLFKVLSQVEGIITEQVEQVK